MLYIVEKIYVLRMTFKVYYSKKRPATYTYSRWNNHIGCFFMASSQHWHSKDLMSSRKNLENVQYDDSAVACSICQNVDNAPSNEFTALFKKGIKLKANRMR